MIDGWKIKTLYSLCKQIQSGGTPKSDNKEFYNGLIPFVSIEDMSKVNKYLYSSKKSITFSGLNNSSAWIVPSNNILYSIYATLGLPVINKIDTSTSQAILGIIIKDNVSRDFIYYWLLYQRSFLNKFSSQTTQANLNAEIVRNFHVLLPIKLKEQQKIAKILTSIDESIEATNKIISKQKRVKIALMQDLLTRGIDENGNIRSEETHEFKDSVLGRIPKEWDISLSADYCISIADGTHDTPKPVKEGYPLYTSKNLVNNKLDKKDFYNISEFDMLNINKRSYVSDYDILFGMIGTIGNPTIINEINYNFSVKNVAIFRFGENKTLSTWFYYYLISNQMNKYIEQIFTGSTQKFISLSNLREFPILFPKSKDEQQKITNILSKQDEAIEQEEQKLHKLQRVKIALMQDLLTGKVRVNYE